MKLIKTYGQFINEASTYNNRGFSFDDIMKIQTFLIGNGFMNNIRANGKPAIDGMFGPETKEALTNYQKSKGLESLGEITDETLKAMNLYIAKQKNMDPRFSADMPYRYSVEPGVHKKMSKVLDIGSDKIEIIDPSTVKIVFASGFKRFTASQWIEQGYKNFVNLTFFEPDGKPTANFYSAGINLGAKLESLGKYWPMMVLKPKLEVVERASYAIAPQEAFSGSDLIVKNGIVREKRQTPDEASLNRRTAVGITMDNDVIVMVTTKSDLAGMAAKMQRAGARDVINMDGGGSSLFVRDGRVIIPTSRAIPTILAW